MNSEKHIFSHQKELITTHDKENLLQQRGIVIWMTGLSGSGKTTLAYALEKELFHQGILTKVLDGDALRLGLNKELGFSAEGRYENIRRTAELATQLSSCGIVVIASLITPTNELRELAKEIIGNNFILCYISTSIEECEKRDVKGHYAKAREGELKNFTGISNVFEIPQIVDITIDTKNIPVEAGVEMILHKTIDLIKKNNG